MTSMSYLGEKGVYLALSVKDTAIYYSPDRRASGNTSVEVYLSLSLIHILLPYTVNRYRYNVETTTSLESDPLYGIAKDLAPTAIYFNTRFFDQAGVTIIDETEESIEAYNCLLYTSHRTKCGWFGLINTISPCFNGSRSSSLTMVTACLST